MAVTSGLGNHTTGITARLFLRAIAPKLRERTAVSRFPSVVAVFPVIGLADVAQDKPDQFDESRFRAYVIRKDQHAALIGLNTDESIGGLSIVATLEEAVTMRAVKYSDAQPRSKVLALFIRRQVGLEKREHTGSRDMQAWLGHFGARS